MPSYARRNFEAHPLRDVDMLRRMHREQFGGPGRPYSVLTRSGIFLLCAAWELYCEEMVFEAVGHIIGASASPSELPMGMRRTLVTALKADKHELAPLRLAGDGWKTYFNQLANNEISSLNTPNAHNVSTLIKTLTTVDVSPILDPYSNRLTEFVRKRGDIAHRGARAGHISIIDLDEDYQFICRLVLELDNFMVGPMRDILTWQPWYRRYWDQ